jgi:hypothetical protein
MTEAINEFDIIRAKFINDLEDLLEKYNAEITAEDHWTGYSEAGEDVRMTVEFNDYKMKDIDLGRYIDKDGHGGSQ